MIRGVIMDEIMDFVDEDTYLPLTLNFGKQIGTAVLHPDGTVDCIIWKDEDDRST